MTTSTVAEVALDRWIHLVGVGLAVSGATVLASRAAIGAAQGPQLPVLVYVVCLVAMLGCSAAYNAAAAGEKMRAAFFRRLDHAAIFLMIAGTYTPFASRVGNATTAVIWLAALAAAGAKLVLPARFDRGWVMIYLAFGWAVLAAFGPVVAMLDPATIALLIGGGILYSIGAGFHLWHRLPFHNAIWHGFVVGAAGCHFAAVAQATG